MILGSLKYSERVEGLHPDFKRVFDYIKSHDLLNAPLERIVLDGDNLFINNVNPECVPAEKQPLEAHKDYLDIHILLEGEERIGWKSIEDCGEPSKAYDKEGDYMLFDQMATSYVDLKPGQFCIVFPEDPHAPLIGSGKVRKLIVKARTNELKG